MMALKAKNVSRLKGTSNNCHSEAGGPKNLLKFVRKSRFFAEFTLERIVTFTVTL